MNKKKMIITSACGSLVIGLSAFAGYEYGKQQTFQTTSLVQNTAQAKKINYSDKVSSVVVSEITDDGYVTLHGDHSHYEKGLVPYNAKILDSLVYKNKDYKLKDEDIQYELAEGYVIKVNGKYYYYPKEGINQSNIVDEKTAKEISAHAHHHHYGEASESKESGDHYTFNPKDIVSETADGYVVRHGDHFHYIKKSELSSSQLSQASKVETNSSLPASTAGITTPTSDGYIFKGENDIIGKNSFGFIVKHGSHQHIIPYSQLVGTKWEYLVNNTKAPAATTNTNTTVVNTPKTNIVNDNHHEHSSEHGDDYKFDPKDIVSEDGNGYTVRHGDHFHYIPKNKVEKTTKVVKPTPVVPVPSLPKENKVEKPVEDFKTAPIIPTPSLPEENKVEKPVESVKPSPVIPTPTLPEKDKVEKPKIDNTVIKPSVLSFAGVQYETSDGFKLSDDSVITATSTGLLVAHSGHQHFVFYKQLVNSKWEKLIPYQYLNKAKEEYAELEKEVNDKINYLSQKNNIGKDKFSYVITANGDAISYNGKTELLKDINVKKDTQTNSSNSIDKVESNSKENNSATGKTETVNDSSGNTVENDNHKEEKNTEEKEIEAKVDYVAKQLNIDKSSIKLIETAEGKALVYPHGDHSHTVLVKDIDTSKPLADPHSNSGAETLKKLGFDDEIIHDIQHASADTDFPAHESSVEKMKEWLKTVKYLNVGQNKDPLKRNGLELMPNIEVLGIGYTPIDDITPVYKFKKLKQLYVSRTGIKDYSFIKNIPTLEGIDFSENDIQDISFLKDYPNLKLVSAAGNNIENIDVLKNLINLESLNLDNNKIKDLSALKDLNHLRAVSLENNNITKLDALSNKNELERLFLSNNSGLELSTLKNDSLEQLTVNNTNIRDLSVVSNLPKLKKLVANDNKITTLSHLKNAKVLESVEVNNNKIDSLDFENSTITSLEIKNNKLEDINNVHKLSALENLDASGNKISEFPTNKQDKLINLTVSNNVIRTMENINNLTALKYLTMSNNYVASLTLKEKNKTLEYLDISHNTIPKEELEIPSDGNIPKGIMNNFEKVEGGDIKENYTLTADYITEQAEKLQEEILKLKDEKKLVPEVADELKQKARIIYLDMSYSVDQSRNKQIELEKQLNEIRKQVKDNLATPATEVDNKDNSAAEHTNSGAEHESEAHDHSEADEHDFVFDVNNIISEEGDGYIVKHGDHNHFIKKSELSAKQLEEAKEFLAKKAETTTTIDKATLDSKKNYIALFYGINVSDISVDNNALVFNYNGSVKRLLLNDITVPVMSSDLEGDFEKEISALASSMNTTVEHIQVQDGQMIVNHGDHNHYYPIKSPGWRTYNQNKIPYIEIPKVSGNIDEAVVNSRLTELENKAQTVLVNNPVKLRKVLNWLNNFRDVSLAWHVTGTDGYLQALDKFEKTQMDI
ncbi:MAG: pneumococcal-type histidine triad protein [Gemella haemolysans]|uniref:pneumococcal-type histidine triad protein n=1 Tax=Gemella haemolysans TaxID=1379 RepID=UPI00290D802B|nr:pneumococcal-type histidine triad protein [Gemella haemolysans]MDU6573403.1 pneumococcal-type histidine triad protein [Gemella haemolysans]